MKSTNKLRDSLLIIAIALLFFFFILYLTKLTYPTPKFQEYCQTKYHPITDKTTCEKENGKWIQGPTKQPNQTGWCDLYYNCSEKYKKASQNYTQTIFYIYLLLGLTLFIIFLLKQIEIVSNGIMLGSIFIIIFGTLQNWTNFSTPSKTALLGIALAILIYTSIKITKKTSQKAR